LDGTVKHIAYDARGLAMQVTDAVGDDDAITLRMERDALGRLTSKHARGRSTGFRYDRVGQLLQAENYSDGGAQRVVHDQLRFAYGSRGELLGETGHMGTLAHQYDELGNRSATVLPDGRVINRLHYGSGHLHQFNLDGETVCDMARDDLHREVTRSQGLLSSAFGYDSLGRKTWEQATSDGGQAPVLRKEWDYDVSGELTRKRHSRHGVTQYLYDPLGRIVNTVQETRRELFHWDAAANLVDSTGPGGYVRHNRVMVFEDKRFEYDAHGRLETKTIGRHTEQRFHYDGEHRLREVESLRNGVRQLVYFTYDALGRRIGKHDAFGVTEFLWDGLRMLQERRGEELATYLYESDSHAPLARIDTRTAEPDKRVSAANDPFDDMPRAALASNVYYFHNDVSGMPEELTAASGEVAWQAEYETWGNTVSETWVYAARADGEQRTRQPLPQNLRFQGQYLDRDTGLHYNTFRFYDPDIGRFVSQDPIGLKGGNNLYQYAPNPCSWIDPLGLEGVDATGRPLSSPNYSAWDTVELPVEQFPKDRPDHFKYANEQLYNKISADPGLKEILSPELVDHVTPGSRGGFSDRSPPGMSWHHNEQDPKILELLPRAQHKAPGAVQKSLHPSQGGGFKKLQNGCVP